MGDVKEYIDALDLVESLGVMLGVTRPRDGITIALHKGFLVVPSIHDAVLLLKDNVMDLVQDDYVTPSGVIEYFKDLFKKSLVDPEYISLGEMLEANIVLSQFTGVSK